jgi:hypothetical protein
VSPHGTGSSRGWKECISAPATLMRLAAGAGREAQERTSIVHEAVHIVTAHSSRTAASVRAESRVLDPVRMSAKPGAQVACANVPNPRVRTGLPPVVAGNAPSGLNSSDIVHPASTTVCRFPAEESQISTFSPSHSGR